MSLIDKIDVSNVPNHVAIIMDGNGRWAKQRGLERSEGHRKGVDSVRSVVEAAVKSKVKWLTIYAFSTENWLRPDDEVNAIMELMVLAVANETPALKRNGVRLRFIGDIERLPLKTRNSIDESVEATKEGKNLTLSVAISYSSRWELTEVSKSISADVKSGAIDGADICESLIDKYIKEISVPDVDLLIRTGGDIRISNFLLWQVAYAELFFTDVFWPDFTHSQFYEAIIDYQRKERRFGKTSEQIGLEIDLE